VTADGGAGVRVARVAVIGAGPAGIYAAQALVDAAVPVNVDVYD
jgi:cation diffusion facilitator CzcD-associated flavoprotein CzcO